MKSLANWISNIQIKKVVTIFLIGLFVFVTQGCSSVSAKSPDLGGRERYKDVNSDRLYEGGMNGYSDVHGNSKGTQDTAKAKSEFLKENSKKNVTTKGLNQSSLDIEDTADKVLSKADNAARDVKESLSRTADKATDKADDLTSSLQEGFENVKDNVSTAPGYFSRTADRTATNPMKSLKRGAEYAGDKADTVGNNLQDAGNTLQRKASRKVDRDIQATQRQLEKTGNAIEDAID